MGSKKHKKHKSDKRDRYEGRLVIDECSKFYCYEFEMTLHSSWRMGIVREKVLNMHLPKSSNQMACRIELRLQFRD
jgi:hypothetical protein